VFNADEDSAKEEARRQMQDARLGYSNADVVVKLQGWDTDHTKSVAQASLSALKQLVLSDKKLPGTHLSYYHSMFALFLPVITTKMTSFSYAYT
jgi:hypothetical protein